MQIQVLNSVICLIVTLLISVNGFLDYKIIEGYFKTKYINHAIIVGCFNKQEQMKIARYFMVKEQMVAVLNIHRISVQNNLKSSHSHIAVILDGDCANVQNFLIKCSEYNYFDVKHHWLILTSSKHYSSIFEKISMHINSDIQVVYPRKNGNITLIDYIIEEVYNPAYDRGGTLKTYEMGFYNEINGYILEDKFKYWIRRNMTGIKLRTAIHLVKPFEGKLLDHLESETNRKINNIDRFQYRLLNIFCRHYYNFTIDITTAKSYGYKRKDGTFDGVLGALERQEIDYGSSPYDVRADTLPVIDFGRPSWNLRAAFVFRNPRSRSPIEIFIKPLSSWCWILTICSTGLVILCLKLSYIYQRKNILEMPVDTSWSYFVVYTSGSIFQQGMFINPYFFAGRIVMLFMLLLSLLVYNFYSASVVSYLILESPTKIKTIKDIVDSNLKVGLENVSYNREYLLSTTDKTIKELYYKKILRKQNISNFLGVLEGVELIRKGQYAFHVEASKVYPIIEKNFDFNEMCELREVQLIGTQTQWLHTSFPKKSPYKDMIDTCLHLLAANGMLSRELLLWNSKKPECLGFATTTDSIGLYSFYPAYMVLGIGMVLSLMILVIEIYVHFKNEARKKSKGTTYSFAN